MNRILLIDGFINSIDIKTILGLLKNKSSIVWVYIPQDAKDTSINRDYAFIKFTSQEEVKQALNFLQKTYGKNPFAVFELVDNPLTLKQEKLILEQYQKYINQV